MRLPLIKVVLDLAIVFSSIGCGVLFFLSGNYYYKSRLLNERSNKVVLDSGNVEVDWGRRSIAFYIDNREYVVNSVFTHESSILSDAGFVSYYYEKLNPKRSFLDLREDRVKANMALRFGIPGFGIFGILLLFVLKKIFFSSR